MRFGLLMVAAWIPPTVGPDPTTSQAAFAATDERVEHWITELGDSSFQRRDEAQRRLADLGEAALPALLRHLDDSDAEVARRVVAILPTPRSARTRAEVAARLAGSGNRERLRRAVLMLFENPSAVVDEFERAAARQRGLAAAVCKPIVEQLRDWRAQDAIQQRVAARQRARDPEVVSRGEQMHAETAAYLAEAAYLAALEALADYQERQATSRPTSNPE